MRENGNGRLPQTAVRGRTSISQNFSENAKIGNGFAKALLGCDTVAATVAHFYRVFYYVFYYFLLNMITIRDKATVTTVTVASYLTNEKK